MICHPRKRGQSSLSESVDKEIAEVVGWNPERGYWWFLDEGEGISSLKSCAYPKYSGDIRAAYMLVEQVIDLGVKVDMISVVGGWQVTLSKGDTITAKGSATTMVIRDSLPQAISHAVLQFNRLNPLQKVLK